jgi:hypothetical protein
VVDAVAPHRLADELEPDEPENDRQARGQENQPVEQAANEEVKVAQPKKREQVGGEDQEWVTGEAEDRRNGVDGEQHVGHPDRDDQDEQRCGVAAPADPGGQPGPVALRRDRDDAARNGQHAAFPPPDRITAAERHPHGHEDEEPPEEVLHPSEPVQGHAAKPDEHATQHEGEQDPEHEHAAVILACHPGAADQEDEHQQVVERQAVLRQPAGEELARRRPAPGDGDERTERYRRGDRGRRPQRRLTKPLRLAPAGADDKVDDQENDKGRDGRGPGPGGNVEDGHGLTVPARPLTSRPS